MKSVSYLITCAPDSPTMASVIQQLTEDIKKTYQITQCFFYGDGTAIAALDNYPTLVEQLIDLSESQHIPLHVCSAAFAKRGLNLSPLGQQDFIFKGLGQFIADTQNNAHIRQF